jgi:hypothetical protein
MSETRPLKASLVDQQSGIMAQGRHQALELCLDQGHHMDTDTVSYRGKAWCLAFHQDTAILPHMPDRVDHRQDKQAP